MTKLMPFSHCSAWFTILAGNPQGRPPPSYPDDSYMHPYEFHQFMSKVKRRASGFQDVLPEFEGWHQGSMLLADKFDSLEGMLWSHCSFYFGGEGQHVVFEVSR